MSANEAIQSEVIRHQIALLQYGNGLSKEIVKLLNEVDNDIIAQLTIDDLTAYQEYRLRELLERVRALNEQAYRTAHKRLALDLIELSSAMALAAKNLLERQTGLPISLPSPTLLRTIATTSPIDGVLLESWTQDMARNRFRAIEKAIRVGMIEGETTDQIVRRIRGTKANKFKDGILEMSRKSTQSLVLTATSTVNNASRDAVYNENDDIIRGVKVVATLDTRTTPICQSRDGKFYRLDEAYPKPPYHINCRSCLTPVTKSFRELGIDRDEIPKGKRASMDGQVPSNTTFGDWLKAQSQERQNQILGPTRAKLFRDNKLDPKDLYRVDGSFKSIDELTAFINRQS